MTFAFFRFNFLLLSNPFITMKHDNQLNVPIDRPPCIASEGGICWLNDLTAKGTVINDEVIKLYLNAALNHPFLYQSREVPGHVCENRVQSGSTQETLKTYFLPILGSFAPKKTW